MGVAQALINLMPPHSLYLEPFAGHGAVLRAKRPAARNVAIDRDPAVADFWRAHPHVEFISGDAFERLPAWPWTGRELVYLDPPYMLASRRDSRPRYRYELTDADHARLLDIARRIPAMVIVSHYDAPLYREALADWSHHTVASQTRRGPAVEHIWANYPTPPAALHDSRFIGTDFRDRQRIKRKAARWRKNFAGMDPLERIAVLSALLAD